MFSSDEVKIIFIEGIFIEDLLECKSELIIDTITEPIIESMTKCPICLIGEADPKHFVIGSIECKKNGYQYLSYGNETFCSTVCVVKFIKKNYKQLHSFGLLENLEFYNFDNCNKINKKNI